MAEEWTNEFRLLLIYKDEISDDKIGGSPLVSFSRTIASHYLFAHPKCPVEKLGLMQGELVNRSNFIAPSPNQISLFPEQAGNKRCDRAVPENCCVWGWWRKPWELHQTLFQRLKLSIDHRKKPNVLLYNQYLRRLFHAKLHDLYFEPHLTTVVVPAAWREKCPNYWRIEHLCGAFFVLDIDPEEKDAKELESFFVDSSSFDLALPESPVIIPPPAEVESFCRAMIDMPPKRSSVRTCENTVLCLRDFRQRDKTAELLRTKGSSESEITAAFQETSWKDLLAVLSTAGPVIWSRLSTWPQALRHLGRKSRDAAAIITRFDFKLFANACSSSEMRTLITTGANENLSFNNLGKALVRWVTSSGERDARTTAALVFKEAWNVAKSRFGLGSLPETYFDNLPAIEAVACAVRHEIGKKFYRDHLSHNVRAALLTSHLVTDFDPSSDLNYPCVAFFSGLYHDIAMPVTTFPDTVGKLAQALASAQVREDGAPCQRIRIPGLLDRGLLRRHLSYVAMIASIPDAPNAFRECAFVPWSDPEGTLALSNKRLLFEELLCASSEEHALISAAVLFDYAVEGIRKEEKVDYDTAFRSLIRNIASSEAKPTGREFTAILQCMALHDRRPAAEHHAVVGPPRDTPVALNLSDFKLPAIVSIADEFQEWGRTIGAIEGIGVVDGDVKIYESGVEVAFTLNDDPKTFSSVPYSLFEFLFGKFRTVGRFVRRSGSNVTPIDLSISLDGLTAFQLSFVSSGDVFRVTFESGFDFITKATNGQNAPSSEVHGSQGHYLAKVSVQEHQRLGRDFLIFRGDETACQKLASACRSGSVVSAFSVRSGEVKLSCDDGMSYVGELEGYRFGSFASRCSPAGEFPKSGPISLMQIKLQPIPQSPLKEAAKSPQFHLVPHPHFLDFDWRFSVRTSQAIINFCRSNARQVSGRICYLGCPTLGLWHHQLFPDDDTWDVLDKGHFALSRWIAHKDLPGIEFEKYDVFRAVPTARMHQYAVVVTDPPWYDPYYKIFCKRAKELVKPGGIIGVTHYPRFDDRKYAEFQRIIFNGIMYELQEFGGMEIDYDIPEFERATDVYKQYEHPALGIYRPGYIDFYQAPMEQFSEQSKDESEQPALLPETFELPKGHHLRAVPKNILADLINSKKFRLMRRASIKRVDALPEGLVGWTTRNTIIKTAERGQSFKSIDDLIQNVNTQEDAGKIPIEKE